MQTTSGYEGGLGDLRLSQAGNVYKQAVAVLLVRYASLKKDVSRTAGLQTSATKRHHIDETAACATEARLVPCVARPQPCSVFRCSPFAVPRHLETPARPATTSNVHGAHAILAAQPSPQLKAHRQLLASHQSRDCDSESRGAAHTQVSGQPHSNQRLNAARAGVSQGSGLSGSASVVVRINASSVMLLSR